MDIPFVSSGATSRTQYGLVRKVENAASPQAADQILLNELDIVRRNLQKPHLSIKSCKECLILILHCTMSLSAASPADLDFAFPHALNLAELGQSPMDKRIGYVFCMELMPPNHELQLMLVNTLRKDLESTSLPRMCLALDVLMQTSNEVIVPAVDTRLRSLLRHESAAVRRRALMACYTLFQRDTERMAQLENLVERRLLAEPSEITSVSAIVGKLKHSEPFGKLLNSRLQHLHRESNDPKSVSTILRTLRRGYMKLEPASVSVILDIIKRASKVPVRTVLREAFMLLKEANPESLRNSRDPNDLYLFVSCLSCLDPSVWAGTLPGTVAVLDEWEVQAVMRLLDSPDGLIRKTTLGILHSVDPTIVETYYSQALHNLSPTLSLSNKNEYVSRLLEILDRQDATDVDQYARHLKELFSVIEGKEYGSTENLPVLEHSVQQILNGIREREMSYRVSCVTALAVCLTEPEVRVGPTLMVIISALVSEYCGKVSISPVEMLLGIAARLASYALSVRDACLLTMLKISVDCDDIPEEVTASVQRLSQHSSAHLRRRCDQFLTLSTQRRVLSEIISRAASPSLPDFLVALTNHQSSPRAMSPKSSGATSLGRHELLDFSPSQGTASTRELRYHAYATPHPIPSLRNLSSPLRPKGSLQSPEGSMRSLSRASDASRSSNELTRTITPGELTLTAAQSSMYAPEIRKVPGPVAKLPQDDLASRADLIVLDSPFMVKPAKRLSRDLDFSTT